MKKPSRHTQIQHRLVALIGEDKLQMEQRMPEAGRIADLVWQEKRLVFEIQCSPIALHEAKKRTYDYGLFGYDVIWILDTRRFSRRRQSRSERWMRQRGAKYLFFSDTAFFLYDCVDSFVGSMRVRSTYLGPIDIRKPYLRVHTHGDNIPKHLVSRWYQTNYLFPGDLLDTCVKGHLTLLPTSKPAIKRQFFWLLRRVQRMCGFFLRLLLLWAYRKERVHY